jgi:hypothetical protein
VEVRYPDWLPSLKFMGAVEYGLHALCLEDVHGTLKIERVPQALILGDAYFDGIDEYTIRVTTEDLATLFHELVHIMQYSLYELEVYQEGNAYWKGEMMEGLSYEESPWELEAHHIEKVLLKCFELHRQKSS